uniref:Uncharacterized protein n=1 Tax=Nelumbo nucifera TaxID=4432 RepID=A0A822YZ06_NELNU|nr:TPA_asm: hypothetical protein HUJ06_007096 [Nelumbo nucifera]
MEQHFTVVGDRLARVANALNVDREGRNMKMKVFEEVLKVPGLCPNEKVENTNVDRTKVVPTVRMSAISYD